MPHVSHMRHTGPIERSPLFSLKFPLRPCNPLLTGGLTPFFPHIRDNVTEFQVAIPETLFDGHFKDRLEHLVTMTVQGKLVFQEHLAGLKILFVAF